MAVAHHCAVDRNLSLPKSRAPGADVPAAREITREGWRRGGLVGQHGPCTMPELADTTAAPGTATRLETLRVAAAAVAAALVVAITAATIALGIKVGEDVALYGPIVAVFAVVPAIIGVAIVAKRPGNVIGWLLLAHGLFVALVVFTDRYAVYGLVEDPGSLPGARWAALWTTAAWPTLFVGIAAIAFVMPDGRFLSERWRRRGILSAGAFAGLLHGAAPGRRDPAPGD
jgi:hypothetical protein